MLQNEFQIGNMRVNYMHDAPVTHHVTRATQPIAEKLNSSTTNSPTVDQYSSP